MVDNGLEGWEESPVAGTGRHSIMQGKEQRREKGEEVIWKEEDRDKEL